MTATIAARLVRPLATSGAVPPAELGAVLARYGLTAADLAAPEARVDHDAAMDLLEAAARCTGDPQFGLHSAVTVGTAIFHVLDYLARVSVTGLDALHKVARYQRLLHDGFRFATVRRGDEVIVQIGVEEGLRFPAAAADFCMASLLLGMRSMEVPLDGAQVFFARPPPADPAEHARILGAPVHFDADGDRAVIAAALLDRPLPGADPALCALIESHADQLLERLPRTTRLAERVRKLVAAELRGGNPSVERVAAQLGMSPRTLRRRLTDDGTSFQRLLDELRRDLALAYLGERDLEVEEAAFLLGFSEASAFRRAFKRWTGVTVADHRRRERR